MKQISFRTQSLVLTALAALVACAGGLHAEDLYDRRDRGDSAGLVRGERIEGLVRRYNADARIRVGRPHGGLTSGAGEELEQAGTHAAVPAGVRVVRHVAAGPDAPFLVEILTTAMHATIAMHPDTYYADEPLRIRVTSTLPGWELTLKSTHLTPNGAGGRIDASEVFWAPEGGEMQDLQVFRKLVAKGPAGVTLVEAPIALVTGEYHGAAEYCGELFVGAQKPGGGKSPLQKIPFCTEVGYYASHSYRNHKMYFHFGHPDEALSGVMDGEVTAECRVSLSLSVSDGRVDKLPLGHGATESVPADATVPLSWRLRESGGLFREPDYQSWNGREVSWSLSGTPGAVQYDLECAVEPGDFQPPGDYGMAITVTLQPVL